MTDFFEELNYGMKEDYKKIYLGAKHELKLLEKKNI